MRRGTTRRCGSGRAGAEPSPICACPRRPPNSNRSSAAPGPIGSPAGLPACRRRGRPAVSPASQPARGMANPSAGLIRMRAFWPADGSGKPEWARDDQPRRWDGQNRRGMACRRRRQARTGTRWPAGPSASENGQRLACPPLGKPERARDGQPACRQARTGSGWLAGPWASENGHGMASRPAGKQECSPPWSRCGRISSAAAEASRIRLSSGPRQAPPRRPAQERRPAHQPRRAGLLPARRSGVGAPSLSPEDAQSR
jgi:hypothetical protein